MSRPQKYHKDAIMGCALKLAAEVGYQNVTRDRIAFLSGTSPALISKYFGTMNQLKRAIMSAAVLHKNLTVLAQGLAAGDAKAKAADAKLKRESVEALL